MVIGVARAFVVGAALAVAGAFVGARGRGHADDQRKGEKTKHFSAGFRGNVGNYGNG